MDNKRLMEELFVLKGMTERLGVIHEAQMLQLKHYPFFLDCVKKSTLKIDPNNKKIDYFLTTKGGSSIGEKEQKIMDDIVKWVRFVVWSDTKVSFYKGKTKIHG